MITQITRRRSRTIPSEKLGYLKFTAIESGIFTFYIPASRTYTDVQDIEYSVDHGKTWIKTINDNTNVNITTPIINAGDYVLWRGHANKFSSYNGSIYAYESNSCNFLSTCKYNVSGDITSLLFGADYKIKTLTSSTSIYDFTFGGLFKNSIYLISAKNLYLKTANVKYIYVSLFENCINLIEVPELPATTLNNACYAYMFAGCTSLTEAPELPATTLAYQCYIYMFQNCTGLTGAPELPSTTLVNYCYMHMFEGCTSLTTAPALPATTLTDYCYQYMFQGCTSLTTAPALPATTLTRSCYSNMFNGCTSLTTAPALPATTLAEDCYSCMFAECSSLVNAPELPATTLAEHCYQGMFYGCTSLTEAPELPATILAENCYGTYGGSQYPGYGMFGKCTSLTEAPELPAKILMTGCYNGMFRDCTNLNYIKAMFITTPGTSFTDNWVQGVAASGTFVSNEDANWEVVGVHGIPEGWISSTEEYQEPENIDYFTTKALENNCQFTLTIPQNVTTDEIEYVEYSIDNGNTWNKTLNSENLVTITTPSVSTGTEVKWRGVGYKYGKNDQASYCSTFSSTKNYEVSGNILTLLSRNYGSNNVSHVFSKLFYNSSNLISAKNLKLPVQLTNSCYFDMFSGCTSLTEAPELPAIYMQYQQSAYCYSQMFKGCTSLTEAPALPAIDIYNGNSCYKSMFEGCTSLTTAPELPATTLSTGCYQAMFNSCTSLTKAPLLPATTLAQGCYSYMFNSCTGLTEAPELPATILATNCYAGMFHGCTSLTEAPELPATTLANNCYNAMFSGCTGLTKAPELPATNLANYCYASMFYGCTGLTEAPELPATALIQNCYNQMFYNCSNLNYIRALFTTTPSNSYTYNWVYGVASSGTFVKNLSASWNVTGVNGVPTNWNIEYMSWDEYIGGYLTFTALENTQFTLTIPTNIGLSYLEYVDYSTDNGYTWNRTNNANNRSQNLVITTPTINAGNTVLWRAKAVTYTNSNNASMYSFFSSTGNYNISGNIMSLLSGSTSFEYTYVFQKLFYNSTKLISAENLNLPVTTLTSSCYLNMFNGCTSLTTPPALPATTLAMGCYTCMFNGCTSLTEAPELPATTLTQDCYNTMFYGCRNLTEAPELPATTLANNCYNAMFNGCTGLTEAPELAATSLANYCYASMFYGCTGLTEASELPATTLANNCYNAMFSGCTGLTEAPELSATTLAEYCYANMFYGCTRLTEAPELPATTLAYQCYASMFSGCTSLTEAPELPATNLAQNCYSSMFYGCTGLTTASELPATTLVTGCYNQMFYNCSNLNYIKALFLTIPNDSYTQNWVYGVAASGTFEKHENATWNVVGTNGVPENWTIIGPKTKLMEMWVDDYTGLEEVKNALADEAESGANGYQYTGNTMTYDNQTCYIWEDIVEEGSPTYLLTTTNDISALQNQSLAVAGITNEFFPALKAFLNNDQTILYGPDSTNVRMTRLISAYDTNGGTIWIDDFHELPTPTVINNPENYGANLYYYYGDLFEYNGNDYYLWTIASTEFSEEGPQYILTTTDDYSTLNTQSMKTSGYTATFNSFYLALNPDKSELYQFDDAWGERLKLIKIKSFIREPIMSMYVDDFPGFAQQKYALEDEEGSGAPGYEYTGNSMTYNGETCYIWETILDAGEPYYLLTDTYDISTLQQQSIAVAGFDAEFTSLKAYLNDDMSVKYEPGDDTYVVEESQLISAYNDSNGIIWVDDFYPFPTEDYLDDPKSAGANLYHYYGDTMEYNGDDYYLWEDGIENGTPKYLLTNTDDITTLLNESIVYTGEYDVQFTSLVVRISEDGDQIYENNGDQQLIQVWEI